MPVPDTVMLLVLSKGRYTTSADLTEDVLAYFDIAASNGPVEAINGRLEHLRGIALGVRNLDHYILRSLIHSGQLQARINAL